MKKAEETAIVVLRSVAEVMTLAHRGVNVGQGNTRYVAPIPDYSYGPMPHPHGSRLRTAQIYKRWHT